MKKLTVEQNEIVRGILEYQNITYRNEIKEIIEAVREKDLNFDGYDYVEACGFEVRIIPEDIIEELWTDSLIEQIKECYDLSNVPSFVEIDWEKTADNCKVDGMGHHFSGYDGSEHETKNYYYFRTN